MAQKKSVKEPKRWTCTEEVLGRNLMHEARKHEGSFIERFSKAAIKMGYKNYASVPPGTHSFISSVGGQSRGKTPPLKEDVPKSSKKKKVDRSKDLSLLKKKTPEQLWYEEYAKSKSLQHGLHPEDEKVLIRDLRDIRNKRHR